MDDVKDVFKNIKEDIISMEHLINNTQKIPLEELKLKVKNTEKNTDQLLQHVEDIFKDL